MDIKYLGHSCFFIKGKTISLVTDPYSSEAVGIKFPKHIEAGVVTVSHNHPDHNATGNIEGNPFIVNGPGEYDIKGISIIGVSSYHDEVKGAKRGINTIYRIEIDGISIVHLGDVGHMLSTAEVDALDGVNILLVPVGGFYTVDAAVAKNIINEIEPSIVIPMHYKTPVHKQDVFENLAALDVFLKEVGKEGIAPQPKLSVTKDKIPEEMQIVVLE